MWLYGWFPLINTSVSYTLPSVFDNIMGNCVKVILLFHAIMDLLSQITQLQSGCFGLQFNGVINVTA